MNSADKAALALVNSKRASEPGDGISEVYIYETL